MKSLRERSDRLGCTVLALTLVPLAGCGAADETDWETAQEPADQVATEADNLATRKPYSRFRRKPAPPPPDHGVGGGGGVSGAGGGGAVDCDVCAKAQACCKAVGGAQLCTFSVATCESLAPRSKPGYVSACRTLITTAFRAQTMSGGSAPASCR